MIVKKIGRKITTEIHKKRTCDCWASELFRYSAGKSLGPSRLFALEFGFCSSVKQPSHTRTLTTIYQLFNQYKEIKKKNQLLIVKQNMCKLFLCVCVCVHQTSFSMPNLGNVHVLVEHCAQNIWPQLRQWCLRWVNENSTRHRWHTLPSCHVGAVSEVNMASASLSSGNVWPLVFKMVIVSWVLCK